MGKYLNVGNAGFASVLRGIYIDKTEMISYINKTLGTKDKLTCVSRPRRFGKSFAAQVLCAYYDRSCFSLIMEFVSLPKDVVDCLIGDLITEGFKYILYNTYNGDLELVKRSVRNGRRI
jgi:hypothetical protein